jgi:hypothetical protein
MRTKIWMEIAEKRDNSEEQQFRWTDNIKMDLKETNI